MPAFAGVAIAPIELEVAFIDFDEIKELKESIVLLRVIVVGNFDFSKLLMDVGGMRIDLQRHWILFILEFCPVQIRHPFVIFYQREAHNPLV